MVTSQIGHHCNRLHHLDLLVLANGLSRAELYNLPPDEHEAVADRLRREGIRAGVHAPLLQKPWYPYPPTWMFLHDADTSKRALSLRLALETLDDAARFGLEYIVIHFPGPVTPQTASLGLDGQRAIAWDACAQLDARAGTTGVAVYLEGFGPSPLLEAGFLLEVFAAFPNLGYCWDSGHMHYAAQRDGFDYWVMAGQLRPHVGSLQLWANRTLADYERHHHIPVHPSQRPQDGWVDIERTVRTLVAGRPDIPVVIESPPFYPAELGGHDYREGIAWVADILDAISG